METKDIARNLEFILNHYVKNFIIIKDLADQCVNVSSFIETISELNQLKDNVIKSLKHVTINPKNEVEYCEADDNVNNKCRKFQIIDVEEEDRQQRKQFKSSEEVKSIEKCCICNIPGHTEKACLYQDVIATSTTDANACFKESNFVHQSPHGHSDIVKHVSIVNIVNDDTESSQFWKLVDELQVLGRKLQDVGQLIILAELLLNEIKSLILSEEVPEEDSLIILVKLFCIIKPESPNKVKILFHQLFETKMKQILDLNVSTYAHVVHLILALDDFMFYGFSHEPCGNQSHFQISLTGIPFDTVEADIVQFFKPIDVECILFKKHKSVILNEAVVCFQSLQDSIAAMQHNNQKIGRNYISLKFMSFENVNAAKENQTSEKDTTLTTENSMSMKKPERRIPETASADNNEEEEQMAESEASKKTVSDREECHAAVSSSTTIQCCCDRLLKAAHVKDWVNSCTYYKNASGCPLSIIQRVTVQLLFLWNVIFRLNYIKNK